MSKDIERIEQFLGGVNGPTYASDQHRQQLRREILGEVERRQATAIQRPAWRVAVAIALIGTAAVAGAVGVAIGRYHVIEKVDGRGYLVQSEDGRSTMVIADHNGITPEQAEKWAAKLTLVKQQGKRELAGVTETAVNGKHDARVFTYRYTMPDGRTVYMGERDPGDKGPVTLVNPRLETAFHELDTQGVPVAPYERTIQGRPFAFNVRKVTLDDGTEVLRAQGTPKKTEGGDKTTWTLEQSLEMPGLNPPAVQWAIFDEDPMPAFIQCLDEKRESLAARLNAADSRTKTIVRDAQIQAAWDLMFRRITADQLYLLTPAPRGTFCLTANTPSGRKWLVTKVVTIDKKAFCWCMPIETNAGETIQIVLNQDNILDLTEVYDIVMK